MNDDMIKKSIDVSRCKWVTIGWIENNKFTGVKKLPP